MIKLSPSALDVMRSDVRARHDREQAKVFRDRFPNETADISDDELVSAIRDTRLMADHYGVREAELRDRFLALGAVIAPRFWEDANLETLLSAPTGTGDIRFGDVSMMLKHAAYHSNQPEKVWW